MNEPIDLSKDAVEGYQPIAMAALNAIHEQRLGASAEVSIASAVFVGFVLLNNVDHEQALAFITRLLNDSVIVKVDTTEGGN